MKGVDGLRKFREFLLISSFFYLGSVIVVFYFNYFKTGDLLGTLLVILSVYVVISLFAVQWLYRMEYVKNKSTIYIYILVTGVIGQWLAFKEVGRRIKQRQLGNTKNLRED